MIIVIIPYFSDINSYWYNFSFILGSFILSYIGICNNNIGKITANSCIENKKTKTQAILQKLQNKQNEQKNKDKVVKKEIKTKVTDDNDKNKIKEEIVEEKINLDDE